MGSADDELEQAEAHYDRRFRELKHATFNAYERLLEHYTSGEIANHTGLGSSTIRKLGSDGDKSGWKTPTFDTCRKIDELGLNPPIGAGETALRVDFGLTGYRQLLMDAAARLEEAKKAQKLERRKSMLVEGDRREYEAPLPRYLSDLQGALSVTARWLPFIDISKGFELRSVSIRKRPPTEHDAFAAYDDASPDLAGDVGWRQAITEVPVAIVLADGGFGKTWLLRHHALTLCHAAIEAFERGDEPKDIVIPIVVHAADLARQWRIAVGGEQAVIAAASAGLTSAGVTVSPAMRELLLRRFEQAEPLHILVDAYDEIFDDGQRAAFGQALRWLHGKTAGHVRLLVTSRRAGYEDPFDPRTNHPAPQYMTLGLLDEPQVRHLWSSWFDARGEEVPTKRLEPAIAPESPLRRFVQVPLIAAFCAWVAETDTVAPTRAGLYGQVVDRFLQLAWKADSPHLEGSHRQDRARRDAHLASLTDLAWGMANSGDNWHDAIEVTDCDRVLAGSGPVPQQGRSYSWEPIRQLGILTQPGAFNGDALGDAPVMWIHRSVAEYLAATRLTTLSTDAVDSVLRDRSWFHPAWANVLDFAIGLEVTSGNQGAVSAVLRRHALSDDDGLGWFATVYAAAAGGLPPDPDARDAVIRRIWRLHEVGIISAPHLGRVLALVPEANPKEIVDLLLQRIEEVGPSHDAWTAIAWSGEPGRSKLTELIQNSPTAAGAAAALFTVNPSGAVEAMRRRVFTELPLHAEDAPVMSELDNESVDLLAQRYRAAPDSHQLCEALAWTRSPTAKQIFGKLLGDDDPRIRRTAAHGVGMWYRNDLDREGFGTLLRLLRHDPDPDMKRQIMALLEVIAATVPWIESALQRAVAARQREHPEPTDDLEWLAANLNPASPMLSKALAAVRNDPQLFKQPVIDALGTLTQLALRGRLDARYIGDCLIIGGPQLIAFAANLIQTDQLDADAAGSLALGLCYATEGDPAVYSAIVAAAKAHRHPLLEVALQFHKSATDVRLGALVGALNALSESNAPVVHTWTTAIRALLLALPYDRRIAWKPSCSEATARLLSRATADRQ